MFRPSDLARRLFRRALSKPAAPPAYRTRLAVNALDDRIVPARVEFTYILNGAQSGFIEFDDAAVDVGEASQSVPITGLSISDGSSTYTEADIIGGGTALLSYGALVGSEYDIDASPYDFHLVQTGNLVDVTIPDMGNLLYVNDLVLTYVDPVVTVAAGADALEGSDTPGTLVFTRTGDIGATLAVSYTVQTVGPGLATPGDDYTALRGTVTFAAGSSTAVVNVTAAHDSLYDPGEEVHVTVDTGTGYTVGSPAAAGITIADDAAGVIDLTNGSGTYWYEVPLDEVDPDEATQSIPLTDFTLVFGGQTFDASSPYFTQVPTADLEYGTLVNITFAITFAAPIDGYASLAVDGGEATAVDAVTSTEEMAGVTDTDPALLVLDFAPVNITAYTETYVINVILEDNTVVPVGSVSLPGSGNPNGTKTGWRNLVFDAMSSKTSLAVKKDADSDTRLRIQAVSGTQLKSVVIYNTTTPAPTGPKVHFREQGGAQAVPTLVYQSSPG